MESREDWHSELLLWLVSSLLLASEVAHMCMLRHAMH